MRRSRRASEFPAVLAGLRGSADDRHAPDHPGLADAQPDTLFVVSRCRRRQYQSEARPTSAPRSRLSRKASTRRSSTCRPRGTTPLPPSWRSTPAQRRVEDANTAIASAQQRFDTFAAATYVNGPSDSYLSARDPAEILATAAAGQTLSVSAQQVVTNLQRARTEQVNKESAARLAKQNADQAVAGRRSQPADRGFGADRSAGDVQDPAGRPRPADRRAGRGASQARRGPQLVGACGRPARRPAPRGAKHQSLRGLGSRTRGRRPGNG